MQWYCFQMMKDNEDFFRLIEYNNFDDCIMPKEYILEISDFEDIEKVKPEVIIPDVWKIFAKLKILLFIKKFNYDYNNKS